MAHNYNNSHGYDDGQRLHDLPAGAVGDHYPL